MFTFWRSGSDRTLVRYRLSKAWFVVGTGGRAGELASGEIDVGAARTVDERELLRIVLRAVADDL